MREKKSCWNVTTCDDDHTDLLARAFSQYCNARHPYSAFNKKCILWMQVLRNKFALSRSHPLLPES